MLSKVSVFVKPHQGMPHIRGGKGEAVVSYCEPLTTKEMGYHRLSRRVNKMKISYKIYKSLIEEI